MSRFSNAIVKEILTKILLNFLHIFITDAIKPTHQMEHTFAKLLKDSRDLENDLHKELK